MDGRMDGRTDVRNWLEGSEGQPAGSEGQPAGSEGQAAGSEGQPEGGRTDRHTDGQNFSPFYRTLSPDGAAAQKGGQKPTERHW